jgi:hypothetical protein
MPEAMLLRVRLLVPRHPGRRLVPQRLALIFPRLAQAGIFQRRDRPFAPAAARPAPL